MTALTVALSLGSFGSLCALAPTLALIEEFDADVTWLSIRPIDTPFTSRPSADDPMAEYKLRRKRARDAWTAREHERDCERLGLDASVTPRYIDARAADAGLQLLADTGGDVPAYLTAVLNRGFVDRRSVADVADVEDLVGREGFDAYVAHDVDARLAVIENELAERRIYTGPAYIAGDEAFIGRQHLPLIRWLLGGQRGSPPV